MNENKFLKNLSQQNGQLPATTNQSRSVEPTGQPTSSAGTEYDPIKRLTDELSRQSRAIEGLNTRIDRMEGRPQGATQAEVNTLLEEAREGVSFTIDSASIARLVLPDLMKGMPSPASLKVAADAGASAITAAGTASAERIEQAGAAAASRIERSSQGKANSWANTLGFTNWRSGLLLGLLPLLIAGLSVYKWSSSNTQLSRAESSLAELKGTNQEWIAFGKWVRVNFADQWKTYTDPAYIPANAYLKKVKPK